VAESRRVAVVVLGLGGAVALLAQLTSPVAVPLYDGLVVQEPYRYLNPSPGQAGAPTSFSTEKPVQGVSAAFVAATTENPPQAQLIALPGAFTVTAATTMRISIEPVPAPAAVPASGAISGNVYRFAVTDQSGAPLSIAPGTGNPPTITLRGPDGVTSGTIVHLGANGWELLPTDHGGAVALFSANPPELGDFAVVSSGGGLPSVGVLVGAILAVAVPVALGVFLVVRQRRTRRLAADTARQRSRIPSKRVAPRPPKGPGRRS
jgi:hypothetical protein